MSRISGLRRIFRFPWRTGGQIEDEVDAELRFHLDRRTEELIDQGMTPEAARREAVRQFGDLAYTKQYCCALAERTELKVRRTMLIDEFRHDVRYGVRMLARSPGFTAVAVLSLALGIGATTTIFSVMNAALLRPLPLENPDRLVGLWSSGSRTGFGPVSYPNYKDYRDQNHVFTGLAAYSMARPMDLSGRDAPMQVNGSPVSGDYFSVLGVRPVLGRGFLPEEDRTPGTHPVVVISHGLWQGRFGSDPNVVGDIVVLNGQPFTVVGVAPKGFPGASVGPGILAGQADVWYPMMWDFHDRWAVERGLGVLGLVGRLKPGISLDQAQADMSILADQIERVYPGIRFDEDRLGVTVVSELRGRPGEVRQLRRSAAFMMTVVGLVLLIACTNVTNMLLARAVDRRKEFGIRLAMGSSRRRLIRQLLTEGLLLAMVGGSVGLVVATWTAEALRPFLPLGAGQFDPGLDGRVVGFVVTVVLVAAVIVGLAPALRTSTPDLVRELKDTASPGGPARSRLRSLLVAAQVAISVVLLIGAGLFVRSLQHLNTVDLGFNPRNVLLANVNLPRQGYDKARVNVFSRQLLERLEGVPGVQSVSSGGQMLNPGRGPRWRTRVSEGQEPAPEGDGISVPINMVGTHYFQTMGIPLMRGRDFSEEDEAANADVIVINETMARQFWAGEDPIGNRLVIRHPQFFTFEQRTAEVVGVAQDTEMNVFTDDREPLLYLPAYWEPAPGGDLGIILRTDIDPLGVVTALRGAVASLDPDLVVEVRTVTEWIQSNFGSQRASASLSGIVGLLAVLLAIIGVYAVMAHAASQRTHEIGIRMALGAQSRDVLALVMREGMVTTLMGVVIGVGAAFWVTRLIASQLHGVTATDPATFATVTVGLTGVALLACYIPARRATKVDPLVALRAE